MRPAFYQDQWQALKKSPDTKAIHSLAQRIAFSFIDRYYYSDEYNAEYITLLCDMATCFTREELNQPASTALFEIIIERLCDDFEELQTETYNRLISQVVDQLRRLPAGQHLHEQLNEFQLFSAEQLYQRIETNRLSPDEKLPAVLQPGKIILLSRVTIGADVAISSVISQRVKSAYPDCDVTIIGQAKLHQVFAEKSGCTIRELSYSRRGGLMERFLAWLDLLEVVRKEISGLSKNDFLILDPDSRLTQLGALPLVSADNYRFFNSRGKVGYPIKASISELTNLWMDNILGHGEFCYPKVWPQQAALRVAAGLRLALDPQGTQHLITVNFGVGGNPRKRVPGDFETRVVKTLLRDPANRIILDYGYGEDERRRSEAVLSAVAASGLPAQRVKFPDIADVNPHTRLLGIQCSVAEIAALIANSDEFIGYDSACQHIAAALGIRTFTVFAGTDNVRFIRRWRASGPNLSELLYVDTLSRHNPVDTLDVVERLMDLRTA